MDKRPAPPSPQEEGESYDAYMTRLLAESPLGAEVRERIASIRKLSFFVATSDEVPAGVGASRIGGEPDLPEGAEWPVDGTTPMSFVAQFRLDELAQVAASPLPAIGLLSFFVAEMGDAYLGKCAVVHTLDLDSLVRTELPEDFTRYVDGEPTRQAYEERGVSFTVAHKLPSPSNPAAGPLELEGQDELVYHELVAAGMQARHQLLGFRDREYDSEQEASTLLLFQCASLGDMTWGDDDELYFYIPEEALAAGAFGQVFPYCGD